MPGTIQQELTRIMQAMREDGVKSVWLSPENAEAVLHPVPAQTLHPLHQQGNGPLPERQSAAPGIQAAAGTPGVQAAVPGELPHVPGGTAPMPFVSVLAPVPAPEPKPAPAMTEELKGKIAGASWDELEKMAAECHACPLRGGCGEPCFFAGAPKPSVVFVGDAPFAEEAAQNRPFAGPAGEMLHKMGLAMKLDWTEGGERGAAVLNILKCRPATPPSQDALDACALYVRRQLELLSPRFLVFLGYLPAKILCGMSGGFSSIKGKWLEYNGIPVMVIQNPAQIMRYAGNQAMFTEERRQAWKSLQEVMGRL